MSNLVFLEATMNSDDASIFVEKNGDIIDFATCEIDSLVEEQIIYTCDCVGDFIEDDACTTYENISEPISDIIVEATAIFGDIIAMEDLSESDKCEIIEGCAHIINMGDIEILEAARFKKSSFTNKLGKMAKNRAAAQAEATAKATPSKITIGARRAGGAIAGGAKRAGGAIARGGATGAAGAVAGGIVGAVAGHHVASIGALFSKDRKAWKDLIKQEKALRKQLKSKPGDKTLSSKLQKIRVDKINAHDLYLKSKRERLHSGTIKGAKIGAVAGGVYGGIVGVRHK